MLKSTFLILLISFSYNQLGNSAPSDAMRQEFESFVANVTKSTAYVYQAKDSAGHTMDTVKIIEDPSGSGYIGVYHSMINSIFHTFFSTSNDLIHWTFQVKFGGKGETDLLIPQTHKLELCCLFTPTLTVFFAHFYH